MSKTETTRERLARHIRLQSAACGELGSPLYAELLRRVADDFLAAGPAADVLAGHEDDPRSSALALRLMGGVHRLVLDGRAPALAAFYPSVGGEADGARAWPVLRDVLADHGDELRSLLGQAPQTNEVGRASALIGGLLHVCAWQPGPIRLFEIGASAGLNLRADRFRVPLADGGGVGPPDSPVVLTDAWAGVPPPVPPGAPDTYLELVDRGGCDTEPLDPTTDEGRLRLTSYVWPDQPARIARLRGAAKLAAEIPVPVDRMAAQEFVQVLELADGATTVLWHSVMWQYLASAERSAILRRLDELGQRADERARFAHLLLEPRRRAPEHEPEFLVVLRTWPGGAERILGRAHPHGIPTTWEQPGP